jgi:hypothetical protein
VLDREIVRNRTPQDLGRALKGRRFGESRRHGKWLIAPVGDVEQDLGCRCVSVWACRCWSSEGTSSAW